MKGTDLPPTSKANHSHHAPIWRKWEARLLYRLGNLDFKSSVWLLAAFFVWTAVITWVSPREAMKGTAPDFMAQSISIMSSGRITFALAPHFIAGIELLTAGLLIWLPAARWTLLWLFLRLVLGVLPLFMFQDQMWRKFPLWPSATGVEIIAFLVPVAIGLAQSLRARWNELEMLDGTWDLLAETSEEAARKKARLKWTVVCLLPIALVAYGAERTVWPRYLAWFHSRQEAAAFNEHLAGRLIKKSMPASEILGGRKITTWVYLPPGYDQSDERYPVVYVMHGMPGEVRDCFVKGRVQDDAEKLIQTHQVKPFIIVGWDGEGPGGPFDVTNFLDRTDGSYSMESFIVKELVPYIDQTYRTIPDAEDRALDGISAGGYAAANLMLKHPNIFKIGASHNGFFSPNDEDSDMTDILGPKGSLWRENDPFELARTRSAVDGLHFYGDIGEGDDLQDEFVRFGRQLKARGVNCDMHIFPGRHTWEFWSQHFNDSFRFANRWFRHPG